MGRWILQRDLAEIGPDVNGVKRPLTDILAGLWATP